MIDDKKKDALDEFLDAVDRYEAGDENAFDGMTFQLDGDDSDDET